MELRAGGQEPINEGPRPAHEALFIDRQGARRPWPLPLLLEEKDRQAAKEGEVLRGPGVPDPAAVLVLGAITAVVLAVFDGPVSADGLEDFPDRGLVFPEAADGVTDFIGGLPHLALAHVLAEGLDAQQAHRSGQADLRRIDGPMPDPIGGDPSVSLLRPLQ